MNFQRSFLWLLLCLVPHIAATRAADQAPYDQRQEIIYRRKFGSALTMDRFTPRDHSKQRGVIFVVSGGWISSHDDISGYGKVWVQELVKQGYTVFAVVPGSQPIYTIPEMVEDLQRSIRFIRFHAQEYQIDPDRLGVYGASAGGHLSLMLGTTGREGDATAKDAVDQVSSRIQAVACLCPPTDFLNYGQTGVNALGRGILATFRPAFEFREIDKRGRNITLIRDEAKILEMGKDFSPVNHVSADDPPTLIIHGDQDSVVPLQQSQLMMDRFQSRGVPHRLIVRNGKDHGWIDYRPDLAELAKWFDQYLLTPPAGSKPD